MFINQLSFQEIKKLVSTFLPNFVKVERHRDKILKTMTIAMIDDHVEVVFKYKEKEEKFIFYDFEFSSTLIDGGKDAYLIADYRRMMNARFEKVDSLGNRSNQYFKSLLIHIKKSKKNKVLKSKKEQQEEKTI